MSDSSDTSQAAETLDELFRFHTMEFSGKAGDEKLKALIEGLRSQRVEWSAEQLAGSKKLVKASSVSVGTAQAKPKSPTKTGLSGLKLNLSFKDFKL